MANDNRDDSDTGPDKRGEAPAGFDSDDFTTPSPTRSERRDPFFTDFEDDETAEIDDIEASDFGRDYEDDDSDYLAEDGPSDAADAPWDASPTPPDDSSTVSSSAFDRWPLEDEADEEPPPPDAPDLWSTPLPATPGRNQKEETEWGDDLEEDEDEPAPDEWDDEPELEREDQDLAREEDDDFDDDDEALDEEDYPEDDYDGDEIDEAPDEWDSDYQDEAAAEQAAVTNSLPWGLLAVGVLALVLLAAGGYGVIQQRAEKDTEIRELRAQLATSADPREVAAARDALAELEQENQALQAQLDSLQLENRRLTDTVSGLETQLEGQQQAAAELQRSAEQARRAAAATAASSPAATTSTGTWFVNFGSYGSREMAEEWASRLRTTNRKVIVAPAASEGRSLYRVRVISLESKAAAERVARELEQAHQLPTLWVGRE